MGMYWLHIEPSRLSLSFVRPLRSSGLCSAGATLVLCDDRGAASGHLQALPAAATVLGKRRRCACTLPYTDRNAAYLRAVRPTFWGGTRGRASLLFTLGMFTHY